MLKIQQIFPKLYRCLLYVVVHNSEPQNAGFVDVERDLHLKKDLREFLCVKNVIWSGKNFDALKQSILAVIFFKVFIHLTEHGRLHFYGRTTLTHLS